MSKPRLLDLFCGAGGAAMGYHRAGFEVVGVDINPQPRYPFEFHQADAMTFPLDGFDAIHASPPCQGESIMRNLPWLKDREYPMLIIPTRERLEGQPAPWVIENVQNARRSRHKPHGMQANFLCGQMFDLPIFRHRLFETPFLWLQPPHEQHHGVIARGRHLGNRARTHVARPNGWSAGFDQANTPILVGHPSKAQVARVADAMGIGWMTKDELQEAIPPVFTEFIGHQLMRALAS